MNKQDFLKQIGEKYSENIKFAIKKGVKDENLRLRYKILERIVFLKGDTEGRKEDPKGISGAIFVLEELLESEFPNLSGKLNDANQKESEVKR